MVDSDGKDNEETAKISFSISRILQNNQVERGNVVQSKHETEIRVCQINERTNSMKDSSEQQNTVLAHPWHMCRAPTHRRLGHPYQSRATPKRKKPRTTFSRIQITELEELFIEKKYLTSSERQKVASYLNLTDSQVKTWFQNRRTKWKRETEEEKEEQRQALSKAMMTIHKERAFHIPSYLLG